VKERLFCELFSIREGEIDAEWRQLLLFSATSEGGRGLKSSEQAVYKCWLAGQALCAPTMQRIYGEEKKGSKHLEALRGALQAAKEQLGIEQGDLLPVDAENFVQYYARREHRKEAFQLSDQYTAALNRRSRAALESKASTTERMALLQCLRAPGASLVSSTIPQGPHHRQTNEAMSYLHRTGLDLSPQPSMPVHCHCGHANGQYAADPLHGLNCVVEKGTSVTDRHDDAKYILADWMGQLGAFVRVEPRVPRGEDGKRPTNKRGDIFIDTAKETYLLDCVVVNGCAPSHVSVAAKGVKEILKQAEANKHREDAKSGLSAKYHAKFIAFAVEAHGGFGDEALEFIQEIIRTGSKIKQAWQPQQFVQGIYRSIAAAVARGNADIINSNLRKSRQAEAGGGRMR
jgi:hypothetical protein